MSDISDTIKDTKEAIGKIRPEQFSPENQEKVIDLLANIKERLTSIETLLWMRM